MVVMLTALRYFVEVARRGSFRGASEKLNVAASAISRQVRLLEEEYGTPLFQRGIKGVELTAAGEAFLVYAKGVEAERDRLRQSIDALTSLQRGHVRVASIDGIAAGPLADIIATFRAQHGGITFQVRSMGTEAVAEAVRNGDAEIGIAFYSTSTDQVRVVKRVSDPLYAIVDRKHPLARSRRVKLSDVLAYPVALPDPNFGIRRLIDAVCITQKLSPRIALETNSIEALRGYARSGAGPTLLPFLSSRRDVESGLVTALRIEDRRMRESSVDIFTHIVRPPSIAASAFLKAVCTAMERAAVPP